MESAVGPGAARAGACEGCASPHLTAAFDGVPFGIVTMTDALGILFVNRRVSSMLQIPRHVPGCPASLVDLLQASPLLTPAAIRQIEQGCVSAIGGAAAAPVEIAGIRPDHALVVRTLPLSDGSWLATLAETAPLPAAAHDPVAWAMRDPLTGLPNRRVFESRVTAALEGVPTVACNGRNATERALSQAVLLIDLDRFKTVNDTLGHLVGDGLLGLVAKRLHQMLRRDDLVSRLGGDEFAVLLSHPPGREAVAELAARIVDLLSRPYLVDGHLVNVGASVGVAVAPADGLDYHALLRAADLSLYHAKHGGRGRFSFFDATMDSRALAQRALEIDLRKALALREFELDYQPQIDLDSNAIMGFEALIRWRHPVRGLVPPNNFIPLAEEIGVIVPLGEWVLREACREASHWPDHVTVAVNVSPLQFEDLPRLMAAVSRALTLSGLPGRRLEIEITETVLLRNEAAVLTALHRFRAMDVGVTMDDFGTGYSSLSQLQSFPFDKIKIDRSFVIGDRDPNSQNAIIRAINALGASLGMATIAEGVETPEQLARIRAEGCSSVQGFLFSRPVAPAHVEALLQTYPRAGSAQAKEGTADDYKPLSRALLQPDVLAAGG